MTRESTAGTCRASQLRAPAACPGWSPQPAEWGEVVRCGQPGCGRERAAHIPAPRQAKESDR